MAGIVSPIKDILTQLRAIEGVVYAAIWNNQAKQYAEGKVENWGLPATFVEITNKPEFKQLGAGYRAADLDIRIHIIEELLDAEDGTMEQNLPIFDRQDAVIEALTGYRPTGCNNLFSVSEEQDYEHTNIYHYKVDFKCEFVDSKGSRLDLDVFDKYFKKKNGPFALEIDITIGADQVLLTEDDTPITNEFNDIYQQQLIA